MTSTHIATLSINSYAICGSCIEENKINGSLQMFLETNRKPSEKLVSEQLPRTITDRLTVSQSNTKDSSFTLKEADHQDATSEALLNKTILKDMQKNFGWTITDPQAAN